MLTQPLLIGAAIGLLSGAHAAIGGMYGDSAFAGFSTRSCVRTIVIGILAAIGIQWTMRLLLPTPAAIVVLFGMTYAAERAIVEGRKTFTRQEDRSPRAPMDDSELAARYGPPSIAHLIAAGSRLLRVVRSLLVAVAFALLLSSFSDSHLQVAIAALGYERAATATYLTLRVRESVPGTFDGREVLYPQAHRFRQRLVPLLIAISMFMVGMSVVAARPA